MIASLGLYLIFQNVISLIWGDTSLSIRQNDIEVGYQFFDGYITLNQIKTIFISSSLVIFLQVLLKYSSVGKNLRAVSVNSSLSKIWGINTNRAFIFSFLIGSLFASVAGILAAYESDLSPNMGFNLFLYGAIIMIIGGTGNIWGLIGGAFLLATAQNLGAYFIDSKWLDLVAYITLILFLGFKPLGFSGKQLKKVEI
jgi:branched-subunit amino acid ABC-type transport system permease component